MHVLTGVRFFDGFLHQSQGGLGIEIKVCNLASNEPVIGSTADHCGIIPAQLELGHIQLHMGLLAGLCKGCAKPAVCGNTSGQSNTFHMVIQRCLHRLAEQCVHDCLLERSCKVFGRHRFTALIQLMHCIDECGL